MTEKWENAEQDYNAGMKYKDIADKYGVTINTVKSWKRRYEWVRNKSAPPQKSVHTKSKKGAPKNEVEQVIDELADSELTDKQKAFVIEYVRLFNATQAYINVYDVDYETAMMAGSRMMRNDKVQSLIQEMRQARLHDLGANKEDILADLMKQSFSDIGDYLDFGRTDIYAKDYKGNKELDVDGNPIIKHSSWVQLKDKSKVDTSLIKKVSIGRDGVVLDLYDKQTAQKKLLEELNKLIPDDMQNAQVRKAKAEADMAESKAKLMNDDRGSLETKIVIGEFEDE
ncbi:terminase small subunit [Weissella paramesenteroides]|uniref:terminase small subunit n=1 Tax=Weissella paramesenteroides TaxID=1249 RepID=UPI00123B1481|nr:terminase small subunit [Weissella paramesenteroides]KAA8455254.1 terminase [Weissella paramesenteroides]KAA8456285.1 terminase [Weissella paramesenteroides]KAA8458224.1 terminase [Weissella paramesenteroides]KAA8460215.1 terminase [Weissella paramesenteroides]KAA8461557.1 terminase [Weissella paramesenteroides]